MLILLVIASIILLGIYARLVIISWFSNWEDDVVAFREHVLNSHPKFNDPQVMYLPHNIEIGTVFRGKIDDLLIRIPYMSDLEIKKELQRSLVHFNDNHSSFGWYAWRGNLFRTGIRKKPFTRGFMEDMFIEQYPLSFSWFTDGFYLYKAHEDFSYALNHRLIAVNGFPIDEVFEKYTSFISVENIYGARAAFRHYINRPGFLNAFGVTDGVETIYTFLGSMGEPFDIVLRHTYRQSLDFSDFVDIIMPTLPVVLVDSRAEGELPLFQQNNRSAFWYIFMEDLGLFYMRINAHFVSHDISQPYNFDLLFKIFDLIEEYARGIDMIIVDSRNNGGGAYIPELHLLFESMANTVNKGQLFYFMNERTSSSALLSAGYMYSLGAVIVGQPSGQNMTFYGFSGNRRRGTEIILPYSRQVLEVPDTLAKLQDYGLPPTDDLIFRPHVIINYTIGDWINNRDPYFDFVLDLIGL